MTELVNFRRTIDMTLGVVGLILTAPLISLMAGIARLETGQSGIFRQTRYGLHGKPFTIYKIRTLDKDLNPLPVTGIFRKFGIDELPQILNLLKGDMSLIGPRPYIQPPLTAEWKKALAITPGFASPATILMKNCEVYLSQNEKVMINLPYVEKRLAGEATFWTDLKMIFDSVRIVISGKADNGNEHKDNLAHNNQQEPEPCRVTIREP